MLNMLPPPPPPTHWMMAIMPMLGSLEVYSMVPMGSDGTGPIDNFWWRDSRYPEGFGPYPDLYSCMEDFKASLTYSEDSKPDNVIEVDFKTKKRRR